MKVLMAYKSTDIESAVKSLDQQKQDVLMKYIYRGFELSSDGNGYGAQLLVWHDKVKHIIASVDFGRFLVKEFGEATSQRHLLRITVT